MTDSTIFGAAIAFGLLDSNAPFMVRLEENHRETANHQQWQDWWVRLNSTQAWKNTGYDQYELGHKEYFQVRCSNAGQASLKEAYAILVDKLGFTPSMTIWDQVRFDAPPGIPDLAELEN